MQWIDPKRQLAADAHGLATFAWAATSGDLSSPWPTVARRSQVLIDEPDLRCGDLLAILPTLPADSVELVIGSPPYAEKGQRYRGAAQKMPTEAWVEWMLQVTEASIRVCRGMVLWVVNGAVRDGRYLPACEGLVWEWHKRGGTCERPCIWHKNAPPNRKDWFGNDWEFVLAFKKPGARIHFDWQAIAERTKFKSGGPFRQRSTNGERRLGNAYPKNALARPRDVFRVTVGGGHMGSKLAHDGEAPFPEGLVEPFIRVLTRPGDCVCDPFLGTGTTAAVASRLGRRFLGIDVRASQIGLTKKRLELASVG
jgi:DNA modification methylase